MSLATSLRPTLACCLTMALATASAGAAERPAGASDAAIDQVVEQASKAFNIAGMAVAIVKDGEVVFAKGYGVRELGKSAKVDTDTLFTVASTTKAFTAAALAILVDEGKIKWDDKVIDHLPQFRLADPYVTREFTIRDLLSHRSGLGAGAGLLMVAPHTDFTRAEVMTALQHLQPATSFRTKAEYQNLTYMVAGEIIPV